MVTTLKKEKDGVVQHLEEYSDTLLKDRYTRHQGFPSGASGKEPCCQCRGCRRSLGREDLEEGLATHPSILAWRIPRTEEPGGLRSMESQSRTRLSGLHTHSVYMPIPISQSIPPPKMGTILILSYLMPCPCSYDMVSFIPVRTTHTDSENERDHVHCSF